MKAIGIGVVGTGFIAGVVANSIEQSSSAGLAAVSSREQARADAFVAGRQNVAAVEGIAALLARDDVDAVYIATPTVAKEAIVMAAIAAGKHVLLDKPLPDHAAAKRMIDAANAAGLAMMDGTHFVHHPRAAAIRAAIPEQIGTPRSLHSSFYFPFADRDNIRFDPSQEPTGAVGDLAWYSMRAVIEYLQPGAAPDRVAAFAQRDPQTNAVMRVTALLTFPDGQTSTLDCGYTAGTIMMNLSLLGTTGVIELDDFVLDWHNSFAFQHADIRPGYVHRTDMAARNAFTFVETPTPAAQDVLMIEDFAKLVTSGDQAARKAHADATLQTQQLLDAIWARL